MKAVRVPFARIDTASAARLCLWFYLGTLFVSVAYILTTGTFNGDFYGVPVTLGSWELSFSILAAVAPYFFGYWLYLRFYRRAPAPTVRVGNALLGNAFFIVTLWFILLAYKYDVGVLGRELYDAPALIKPFIQITNRLNPFYLGAFFIVGYKGAKKTIALGIALMITLGLLRAGLGVFMYVLLALVIRNHRNFRGVFRRHFFKIVIMALVLPLGASQLYSLRSELRDKEDLDASLTATEIITARLVGRLSSISNSSFVLQEIAQFRSDVKPLDPWYFQRQSLAPLLGVGIIPEITPERLLINVNGSSLLDVSFMTGVAGNLLMAASKSPLIAVMNLITMISMCWLTFYIANKLALPYRNEVAFMLLLYPLTSGVGNEFSGLALSMLALVIVFTLVNSLSIRKRRPHALQAGERP